MQTEQEYESKSYGWKKRRIDEENEIQEERAHIVILDHNYQYIYVQGAYMVS